MLSRVRKKFQGAKFARMSSGTYCVIRDLGLVKGGKGMRHHEVLVTFSFKACWRAVGLLRRDLVGAVKRRLLRLQGVPQGFEPGVQSTSVPERLARR
jgi:hypothetical protein